MFLTTNIKYYTRSYTEISNKIGQINYAGFKLMVGKVKPDFRFHIIISHVFIKDFTLIFGKIVADSKSTCHLEYKIFNSFHCTAWFLSLLVIFFITIPCKCLYTLIFPLIFIPIGELLKHKSDEDVDALLGTLI